MKPQGPERMRHGFSGDFYQMCMREIILHIYNLIQKIEEGTLSHSVRLALPIIQTNKVKKK
jgi:hypothetical protein